MGTRFNSILWLVALSLVFGLTFCTPAQAKTQEITDAAGRTVSIPAKVDRVVCSGPGCLRLLTYLQAQDLAVAVDDAETKDRGLDARPYALANPQFKTMPVFGTFRGQDNPERLLALDPGPQVIFKTYPNMGYDPQELQDKTGIPVVVLDYGDLAKDRDQLFQALEIMGRVIGKPERAAAVVSFFESAISDLQRRSAKTPKDNRPSAYIGGVAFKGPHGFQSTEPDYPPFEFVGVDNTAFAKDLPAADLQHMDIDKERLLEWDPRWCFVDLSTLQLGALGGAVHELKTEPAYQALSAVQAGRVYGLLPYNWYTKNFGSILANAYFIGSILYPKTFADIDPVAKADEIYAFLVGQPVFDDMDQSFDHLVFSALE